MTNQTALGIFVGVALMAAPALSAAQEALTLDAAVERAVQHNPAMRAARASQQEAAARTDQARSAFLPRVDLTESWQRGNQPVFVFGSLLNQRRFGIENFDINRLNHPDPLANFRLAVAVEQVVYDAGRARAGARAANLGERLADLGSQDVAASLRVAATQLFGQVLMARAQRRAAEGSLSSAEEDARRVERRRDAGMATESDVLAVRVFGAQTRERLITATSQEAIARAQLNEVMGEPLDQIFQLQDPPPVQAVATDPAELEKQAVTRRPDLARAAVRRELASEGLAVARAGYLPQAAVQAGYEWNGGTFANRMPAWSVGVVFRWNLFAGAGDAARVREARAAIDRATAERDQLDAHVRVEVRTAAARVEAATARAVVGQTARSQAQESQRIVRDRYDAGLASINDLLRAASSVLDADLQFTTAEVDVFVSAAMLDRARGK